jgi:hypothetical protein
MGCFFDADDGAAGAGGHVTRAKGGGVAEYEGSTDARLTELDLFLPMAFSYSSARCRVARMGQSPVQPCKGLLRMRQLLHQP